MNSLFNTVFETELRLLIMLEVIGYPEICNTTAEKLAAVDFVALYGASFGITGSNLHGDGDYRFSEFATRRELTQKALRELVGRGFVRAANSAAGFVYTITGAGKTFCKELNDEYAGEYREALASVLDETGEMSEQNLAVFINQHSVNSLKRS